MIPTRKKITNPYYLRIMREGATFAAGILSQRTARRYWPWRLVELHADGSIKALAYGPKRWQVLLADAHALLDEAAARSKSAGLPYVRAAARLCIAAEASGSRATRATRAAAYFEHEVDLAERRIAMYGCCGCLAEMSSP